MEPVVSWIDALTAFLANPNSAKTVRYGYYSHDTDTPPASEKAIEDGGLASLHSSTNDGRLAGSRSVTLSR